MSGVRAPHRPLGLPQSKPKPVWFLPHQAGFFVRFSRAFRIGIESIRDRLDERSCGGSESAVAVVRSLRPLLPIWIVEVTSAEATADCVTSGLVAVGVGTKTTSACGARLQNEQSAMPCLKHFWVELDIWPPSRLHCSCKPTKWH